MSGEAKKFTINGNKISKQPATIKNGTRYKLVKCTTLMRQIEAVADNDPTKVNIKEYMKLVDEVIELGQKYAADRKKKRSMRDQQAYANKRVDSQGLDQDGSEVAETGDGAGELPGVDLRVPAENPFTR